MIFRKTIARPVATTTQDSGAFAATPHRRVILAWRRDDASGRVKMVWKLIGDRTEKSGA
jgi:hypothetical protein